MAGSEVAKKNLYDAATRGEVERFKQLLQEDVYLLNEVSFAHSRNLLHVATISGRLNILPEVLNMNPGLAREVDSNKSSSLHIAAAQGHYESAKRLVSAAPEMCWWRDDQGMNPVHVAAMNGHVEVPRAASTESFACYGEGASWADGVAFVRETWSSYGAHPFGGEVGGAWCVRWMMI